MLCSRAPALLVTQQAHVSRAVRKRHVSRHADGLEHLEARKADVVKVGLCLSWLHAHKLVAGGVAVSLWQVQGATPTGGQGTDANVRAASCHNLECLAHLLALRDVLPVIHSATG